MSKKTAMQEFINYLEAMKEHGPECAPLGFAIEWAKINGLEIEKKQTVDFHIEVMKQGLIEEGERKWHDGYLPKVRNRAEDYYNQTFNQ